MFLIWEIQIKINVVMQKWRLREKWRMLTATRRCDYQTNYFVSGVLTTISFLFCVFSHMWVRDFFNRLQSFVCRPWDYFFQESWRAELSAGQLLSDKSVTFVTKLSLSKWGLNFSKSSRICSSRIYRIAKLATLLDQCLCWSY